VSPGQSLQLLAATIHFSIPCPPDTKAAHEALCEGQTKSFRTTEAPSTIVAQRQSLLCQCRLGPMQTSLIQSHCSKQETVADEGQRQAPRGHPAALDGPVRTSAGIELLCPPTSVSNETARNPQAPAIFTRPQPSDARHPHTLHELDPSIRKTSSTTLNIRHLQLSNVCLRIGMEDDILHFPEGVREDDVVRTGLVGMVALREDRKTATSVSSRIWQC